MKRNTLTTAVVAGIAGVAGLANVSNAVNLNPDGLGQVLLYPYYTVNAGNQTLLSIVNTRDEVKAVKVRFLESLNSREVLDFNLYLSPFDVWTAAVFANGDTGPGNIITFDESCTTPIFVGETVPFRTFAFSGALQDHPNALVGTHSALERTREGHVEMIEMAVIESGPADLGRFAIHGAGQNCAALEAAWDGGAWTLSAGAEDALLPSGGLFGAGAIVDVTNGTMYGYTADAIDSFYTDNTAPASLHTAPGSVLPSLNNASNGPGFADSFVFYTDPLGISPEVIQSTWLAPNTVDAVSAVYMHDALFNEYSIEAGLGSESEWVITFPTKRFYVDLPAPPARQPFTDIFRDDGAACEEIALSIFDREENAPQGGGIDFSPPQPGVSGPQLCFESNVLTFGQVDAISNGELSAVLGSAWAENIEPATFETGWMQLSFTNPLNTLTDVLGDTYQGLPATGFWAWSVINTNAQPGILANYSGLFKHRASRECSNVGGCS